MARVSYDFWFDVVEIFPQALKLTKTKQKQALISAMRRALGRASVSMKARAARIVVAEYNISVALVKKQILSKTGASSSSTPWLRISAMKHQLSLMNFSVRRPTVTWTQRVRGRSNRINKMIEEGREISWRSIRSRKQKTPIFAPSRIKKETKLRRGKTFTRRGPGVSVKIKKSGSRQIIKRGFVNEARNPKQPLLLGPPKFQNPKQKVTAVAGLSVYDTLKAALDREDIKKAGIEAFRNDFKTSINIFMQKAKSPKRSSKRKP